MKRLTFIVLISALAGFAGCSRRGTSTGTPAPSEKSGSRFRGDAEARAKMLKTRLSLDDDQTEKVRQALESLEPEKQAADAPGVSAEARTEKLNAVSNKLSEQMKGILTPAQFSQWEAGLERRRERAGGSGETSQGRGKGRRRHGGGRASARQATPAATPSEAPAATP